ncbi:MAG: RNA 2'-phosphotransferase [Propionibacteriaceae bacterium]|nr:RNA 2'-phosphotransferase [Propionibacteriaceae bacterium]
MLTEGLLPMSRQQVHMATDVEMAHAVGSRHASRPVILRIDAAAAQAAGIQFYPGSDRVWMAETIPARYLSKL